MELYFPAVLDGATGTELQKRGYTGGGCAEAWLLEHPDAILDVQRRYVAAGSDIIYTPTFGANRVKLEANGIFNRVEEFNLRLAALSKEAAAGPRARRGRHRADGPLPRAAGHGELRGARRDIYGAGRRAREGGRRPLRH